MSDAPLTLEGYLNDRPRSDAARAVSQTVLALAGAARTISGLLAQGPLAGALGIVVGTSTDGDTQKELDRITNALVVEALGKAPVGFIASEEMSAVMATSRPDAPLCVAIDPLDGSSNIDTNVSVGTIFSILPRSEAGAASPESHFLQPGARQLAAGYFIYGPHTSLVLTVGAGTHIFTFDPADRTFKCTANTVQVPADTREFAINASNYRHWDEPARLYVDDCLQGEGGPRGKNFNTRWIASMVAECHRILMRGGIYLYPADARRGYRDGRLRLVYEGNPIAMLLDQAGGAASTGMMRVLDVVPSEIHQRIPLIFGSVNEVAVCERYMRNGIASVERSPLFGRRGLFRH